MLEKFLLPNDHNLDLVEELLLLGVQPLLCLGVLVSRLIVLLSLELALLTLFCAEGFLLRVLNLLLPNAIPLDHLELSFDLAGLIVELLQLQYLIDGNLLQKGLHGLVFLRLDQNSTL